jgi:5'-nucleotidase
MTRAGAGRVPVALALLWLAAAPRDQPATTLSIVGTSDLHGAFAPRDGARGLSLFAGYVKNLRAARARDHGAVILLDSGDTFQGDVESDLSEGALIVDAYNAIGYTAEAIGTHDFDFGAVDSPLARQLPGDRRGAVKARAAQAHFPFLAANLIDEATGRPVEWRNVRPSVLVEAAGIKVGIVGVMTIDAMQSTIAANIQGLRIAPLAPAIATEASKLRAAGADVVLVAAHAGGRCERFDHPEELASCESDAEIFRVARALPHGLVDAIAAGHTHAGIGHLVEGIGIIEPFSRGQSFGRVDVVFDRGTRRVTRIAVFGPQPIVAGDYEGKAVAADPAIARAMAPALQRVHDLQATPLGLSLETPVRRAGPGGSPLGDLFATALREAAGADVAAINNADRGLRTDLPAGPLTLGRLYDVFPFDNRLARITMSGADLVEWVTNQIRIGRRSGLGVSGVEVRTSCHADGLHVALLRDGKPVRKDDQLTAVTIGGPSPSGSLASSAPVASGGPIGNAPVVRELIEDWFRTAGNAARVISTAASRASASPSACPGDRTPLEASR